MKHQDSSPLVALVSQEFEKANVPFLTIEMRSFPGEDIVIVEVAERYDEAIAVAKRVDSLIPNGFVTVRHGSIKPTQSQGRVQSIHDSQVSSLIELLSSRSRSSENQPSLKYIPDIAANLQVAMAPRHTLIFGRRGAGKTALIVEAKRLILDRGDLSLWLNMQTLRALNAQRAFLTFVARLCDLILVRGAKAHSQTLGISRAEELRRKAQDSLSATSTELVPNIAAIVPELQGLMTLFCAEIQSAVFLFFDDLHYLERSKVPIFLDYVHGITRDNPVWIKTTGIRNQMTWFTESPPTGLQTPHDATLINLDFTLQEPQKARAFLIKILVTFVEAARAHPVSAILASPAIDRLVMASGGVPRDFFTLCASTVQIARRRANARTAGVQDVNAAAGEATKTKIQELEEDAAASGAVSSELAVLRAIRKFCLDENHTTYFRVDFRDRETMPREYAHIQSLMDLRMIHLIHGSISDEREAGRRSEVFMMDLSEYSGSRLRKNLSILDLDNGVLVAKKTGLGKELRRGDSPAHLLGLLRRGPFFPLSGLSNIDGQVGR